MTNNIVSVKNLSHKYSVQWAIKDISFDITSNGVTGLLGSNGAGKSTTMNIICGVLNQTAGDVHINGVSLKDNPVKAKQNIGFLPQIPPLYADLTVKEYLTHCAHLRLMPLSIIGKAVEKAMKKCSITHFADRIIHNLSGGYRQRVGIAQAIVHNPQLVVLDEPTNGLDPNQIVDIRNLIRELSKSHSILLSTHILSEVQAVCDNIRMIENGNMVFSGTMDDFDNYIKPESFTFSVNNMSTDILAKEFNISQEDLILLNDNEYRIKLQNISLSTSEIISMGYEKGWDINSLQVNRSPLNEIFAQISRKKQ